MKMEDMRDGDVGIVITDGEYKGEIYVRMDDCWQEIGISLKSKGTGSKWNIAQENLELVDITKQICDAVKGLL